MCIHKMVVTVHPADRVAGHEQRGPLNAGCSVPSQLFRPTALSRLDQKLRDRRVKQQLGH